MKAIYVAGPYRAGTAWQVHKNVNEAEWYGMVITEEAWNRGISVVTFIPHTMTRNFDGTFTDDYWLEATAELLVRSDAVFLIPKWQGSVGATLERERAMFENIPVFDGNEFDGLDKLARWIDAHEA